MLETLMEKMAKEMELPTTFETTVQGIYSIPVDENTNIKIVENPPGFSFECTVCPCPTQGLEEFFSTMLLADLFGRGTRGAVLGLSDDAKSVLLRLDIDYNIEYKEFRDKLEDFLNAVDFWREEAQATAKAG